MASEDGDRTLIRKVDASTDARLTLLETESNDLARRVAILEVGGSGSDEPVHTFWNSTNGKWLIAGGVVIILALLGWNVTDIKALLGA